jgi:outer membrane protein assembly factor BamB
MPLTFFSSWEAKRCRMLLRSSLCVLSGLFAGSVASGSENWSQFRGERGDGHSTAKNLPLHWSENSNVVWKQAVPGKGWSSPVIAEGKVFLTTAVADADDQDELEVDRSLRALALDVTKGTILWDVEIFIQSAAEAPRIHGKNSHASVTPLIEGDRVYVHFGHMGTACLNFDGEILWKTQELSYSSVHGNGGCPIIAGDHLIFSCDGKKDPFVAALKKDSGKVAWKTPRKTDAAKTFSFSTPAYFVIDGVPQVISPGSNTVCAFDPKTGRELWRCAYDGYSVIPKPLLAHGLILISTGFDNASIMAIKPGKTGDVAATNVAWTIEKRAPHTPSFLVIGDELFFVADSGMGTCADARTGEIHWQERTGGSAFSASPIFADGRIYLQDERGKSVVLAPGKDFKVLATNELDGKTLASYAAIDGALFIRSDTHLYRIGKTK